MSTNSAFYHQGFTEYRFSPFLGDLGPFWAHNLSCPTLQSCHKPDIDSTYPKDEFSTKKPFAYRFARFIIQFDFDIQTMRKIINKKGPGRDNKKDGDLQSVNAWSQKHTIDQ